MSVTFNISAEFEGTKFEPMVFDMPGEMTPKKWALMTNTMKDAIKEFTKIPSQLIPNVKSDDEAEASKVTA